MELLVAVAIIGLLASIVLVSLSRARSVARDTAASEYYKNVVNATKTYYMDNRDFPHGTDNTGSANLTHELYIRNYVSVDSDQYLYVYMHKCDSGTFCTGAGQSNNDVVFALYGSPCTEGTGPLAMIYFLLENPEKFSQFSRANVFGTIFSVVCLYRDKLF